MRSELYHSFRIYLITSRFRMFLVISFGFCYAEVDFMLI